MSKSLTLSIKVQRVLWFLKSNVLLRFFHINSANTHTLKSDRLGLERCVLWSWPSHTHSQLKGENADYSGGLNMHLITAEGNVQTRAAAAINYILPSLTGGFQTIQDRIFTFSGVFFSNACLMLGCWRCLLFSC